MSAPCAVRDGSDPRLGGGRKGASAATSATAAGNVIDNPRAASPAARLRRWSIVRRAVNGRRTSPTRSANRNIAGHCSRKALIIPRGHGVERYIPAWRCLGRYTFVLSVLVYIALLATFGQDQGLLRYLPEVIGRGDRAAAHDLLRKSAIAIVAVWALTSVFVFALRPVIDSVLHAQVADLLALGTVLLLGGIAAGVLSFALVAIYDMRSQAFATP